MSAEGVGYVVLRATLRGDEAWGEVYAERAPVGAVRPYVVVSLAAGTREQWRGAAANASLVYTVKCVGNTMGAAIGGQARLIALLDGQGSQEGGGLASDDGWDVLTVTAETSVNLVEAFEGVDEVYHAGHQYRLDMESK